MKIRLIEHPAKFNNYLRENHPEWIAGLHQVGKTFSLKSPEDGPNPPFTVSIINGEETDLRTLDEIITAYKVYYNYKD